MLANEREVVLITGMAITEAATAKNNINVIGASHYKSTSVHAGLLGRCRRCHGAQDLVLLDDFVLDKGIDYQQTFLFDLVEICETKGISIPFGWEKKTFHGPNNAGVQ